MIDASILHILGECSQVCCLLFHHVCDGQPTQAVSDLRGVWLPHCVVLTPDTSRDIVLTQIAECRFDCGLVLAQIDLGACVLLGQQSRLLLFYVGNQRVVRIGKGVDAIHQELICNFCNVDARCSQIGHDLLSFRNGVYKRRFRVAVVHEVDQGRRRRGVDRIRAYQRLYVEYIAVGGVLGACAGPQRALYLRTLGLKRREPFAGNGFLEIPIRQRSVGDGCFAQ